MFLIIIQELLTITSNKTITIVYKNIFSQKLLLVCGRSDFRLLNFVKLSNVYRSEKVGIQIKQEVLRHLMIQ